MADFDTVLIGTLVLPDRIVERGFVAISGEKIAAVGDGSAPAARGQATSGRDPSPRD